MAQREIAWLLALGLVGGALFPLDARAEAAEERRDPPAASSPARYQVSGETTDKATGARRAIAGTIVLDQKGGEYTASFELRTVLPGSHAAPAVVLGTGAGRVEGKTLHGSADTQLLTSDVPGVDAGFLGMPRQISARVRSKSVATIGEDGSLTIAIENEPAVGDTYRPTRTVLRGTPQLREAVGAGP